MSVAAIHRPIYGLTAQFLAIQSDPANSSATIAIGNPGLTMADCGVKIFTAQTWPIYSMDANLIQLSNICFMSDTDGVKVNVSFLTR